MRRSKGSKELHLQPELLKPTSSRENEPEVTGSHPLDGVRYM